MSGLLNIDFVGKQVKIITTSWEGQENGNFVLYRNIVLIKIT